MNTRSNLVGRTALLTLLSTLTVPALAAGGTPTTQPVKVTNTAAEAVPVTGTVAISSSAQSPVTTSAKQRERFQASAQASHTSDMGDFYAHAEATFTVPAGKKLIVEHVSLTAVVTNLVPYMYVQVIPDWGAGFSHVFHAAKEGVWTPTSNLWLASAAVPMTATTNLTVKIQGGGGSGLETYLFASVSGYLVPAGE